MKKILIAMVAVAVGGAAVLGVGAWVLVRRAAAASPWDTQMAAILGVAEYGQTAEVFFQPDQAGTQTASQFLGDQKPGTRGPRLIDVAADQLGMTREELLLELSAGKSIAEVAQAKGVTPGTIIDAFLAPRLTKLDAAVQAGKLTQAEADALETLARGRVERALNASHPPSLLAVAADRLGMTQEQLVTKLRAGHTLREIIDASGTGVTADEIVTSFVDSRDEKLAQAVADGKLTQAEADAAKVLLRGRAERLLDKPWPWRDATGPGNNRNRPRVPQNQGQSPQL